MTTSAYQELPASSSTTETIEQQPSPAELNLDDMHEGVSIFLFSTFCASAAQIWDDLRHWNTILTSAIVFLYVAVMMNLLLIKRRNKKTKDLEAACEWIIMLPELTRTFMLVATGVMIVSLRVAIFTFRPDWLDLAYVAFSISASTAGAFLFLKIVELERKRALTTKCDGFACIVV